MVITSSSSAYAGIGKTDRHSSSESSNAIFFLNLFISISCLPMRGVLKAPVPTALYLYIIKKIPKSNKCRKDKDRLAK